MNSEGLLRRHYRNMLDSNNIDEYYEKHINTLTNVVFKDTYVVCRFVPLYFDIILKSHKTIEYSLRNSFSNSHEFFLHMKKNENNTKLGFLEKINNIPREIVMPYIDDIVLKVLKPILKRHETYSQCIIEILFIKLVLFMLQKYSIDEEEKKDLNKYIVIFNKYDCFLHLKPLYSSSNYELNCWKKIYMSIKNGTRNR